MNRCTVFPVYWANTVSQNDSQRNEIMNGGVHQLTNSVTSSTPSVEASRITAILEANRLP